MSVHKELGSILGKGVITEEKHGHFKEEKIFHIKHRSIKKMLGYNFFEVQDSLSLTSFL